MARFGDASPGLLAAEAASALAEMGQSDVAGLVPGCRRLIERYPANGPLWWLAARVLTAAEPREAAREAAAALASDPTLRRLAATLPDDVTVLVVGWPDAAETLGRRADLEVLVVDGDGEGAGLQRSLVADGIDASLVPSTGVAAAATVAGLVLVEAVAAGPTGLLAAPGSHAAAAVAARAGVPVWAVTPVGRVLPEALWSALLARLDASGTEPWDRHQELVPADLVDVVVGPDGAADVATSGMGVPSCPVAPELLRARP